MTVTDAPAPAPAAEHRPAQPAYAHWWRRAVGSLLDGALVAAVAWLATGAPLPVPALTVPWLPLAVDGIEPAGRFSWWTCGAVAAVLLLQALVGVTPGKAVVGIRLVRESDGAPAGVLRTVGREVLHLLDWVLLIGWLRPLWHPRRQTFADTVASTVVVRSRVDLPARLVAAVLTATAAALVVAPTVGESGAVIVSCTFDDTPAVVGSISLRVPGDVEISRLGIHRSSPATPSSGVTWEPAKDGPPADGTQLHASLAGDDGEAWTATVTFRDGAAWTDDVTQVEELRIPHDAWTDAGRGAMVAFTSEVDGVRSPLCGLAGPSSS